MSPTGAALLSFVAIAAGAFGFSLMARTLASSRALARLGMVKKHSSEVRPGTRRALLAGPARAFSTTRPGGWLADYAAKSHPTKPFSDVVALALASVIGGALAGLIVFGPSIPVLFAAVGGPVVLDRVLQRRGGRRTQKLEAQLPEAFGLQAAALRAGRSVVFTLRLLAEEADQPLSSEMEAVVREIELGRSLEVALNAFVERAGSRDVQLWVTAIVVNSRTGGNLASVIDSLAATIRGRSRLQGELRAVTAQARMSGLVVALAPAAFFVLVSAVSREQMKVLYTTPVGLLLLAIGVGLQFLGYIWIRRILKINV